MFSRTESFQQFIRYYPIVTAIILIHILLYLATALPIFPGDAIFETLAGVNLYIAEGEFWRLVTPMFLHSGFAHVLFNSFSLVLFGPGLEKILGKPKFLLLYVVGGIIANIATFLLNPPTYIHVGSSGAIFSLFGFYISLIVFKRHALSQENSQIILTITVIGVIMTFLQPNINITAHIFGLFGGFLIGAFFYSGRKNTYQTSWRTPQIRRGVASLKNIPPQKLIVYGIILVLVVIGIFSRY